MMERTESGWQARLRPRGAGRFLSAGFMLLWLCIWACGEAFVTWLLVRGAIALVTGEPPGAGREPLQWGPALAIGAFLIAWLAFWTLGGIIAIRELLRLTWSEDVLIARSDGLTLSRRLGPFRPRRELAKQDLRWITLRPRAGALVAETATATVELTSLWTREERGELAALLRREYHLEERASGAAVLPLGWQEIITPEGVPALVVDLAHRATQARVAGGVGVLFATIAAVLTVDATRDPSRFPLAALAVLATVLLAWGTLWLARGRVEWRIGNGRLTLQRRYGPGLRELFEARALELTMSTDGDGDEWFALVAVASTSSPPGRAGRHSRRRVHHAMNDAAAPRRLGEWLAARADLPFADRATRETREAEFVALRGELARAGAFGRRVSGWLDKLEQLRKR